VRTGKRILAPLLASLLLAVITRTACGAEGPDFRLESAGGESVSLSQFVGRKPVLLVFWATWCPYCNAAVPGINDLQSRLSDRIQILAIDLKESREKVAAFMKAKGVAYPVLFDGNGSVARQYGVVGIPTFVLLDRKGRIVYFDNILPADIEKRL